MRLAQGPLRPVRQVVPRRLNELLDDPDRGRARRAMDAMLQMHKIEVAELERAADAA